MPSLFLLWPTVHIGFVPRLLSSCSSSRSSPKDPPLSHHKKRTNSAQACVSQACTPAGWKVSIDDVDDRPKKVEDLVSTLKHNVETNPGMYIYSSFRAFLGLENNDLNRTPMLDNTPVMPPQDLQALYKNQVALPKKGATSSLCALFTSFTRILIVYQDPQKIGVGGTTGPTDHRYDRTVCQLHTDLKYQPRPDIHPQDPSKLPVAPKTVENSAAFEEVLSFIKKLTINLGQMQTIPFRLCMIRYMCGNGMGWHSDSLRATDRQGGYWTRLVFNLGESRKNRFAANPVNIEEVGLHQTTCRYPGLGFEIMTIPGFSAYLMSPHGNGGCYLGYTNESNKVTIQVQHSVTKIGANEGGSGAFVCDYVVNDLRAAMQALYAF